MPASVNRHNFDPTQYKDPVVNQKNGKYEPTDYQAAQTLRNFIKNNSKDGFINGEQVTQGAERGQVTINGKQVALTSQQQAAFAKLKDNNGALFNRFDGGTDGKHDNYIGVVDINTAIQKGRLHGTQTSKEGYWSNPNASMTGAQAGTALENFFKQRFGDNWGNNISRETLQQIANNDKYHGSDDKWTSVGDHNVTRAAGVLLSHWDDIQIGGGNSLNLLSAEELAKLKTI